MLMEKKTDMETGAGAGVLASTNPEPILATPNTIKNDAGNLAAAERIWNEASPTPII